MAIVEHVIKLDARQAPRELAKVGGSAKDAAAELDRLDDASDDAADGIEKAGRASAQAAPKIERLEKAADDAGDKADDLGKKIKGAGDAAGDADSIMQGLAGAVEKVSPAAAGALQTLGDLSGGLEALLRVGGLSIAGMGAIGVAVGAAALAYQHLAGEVEAAEEKMAQANQRAAEAVAMAQKIDAIRLRAAIARGELTEEEGAAAIAQRQAGAVFSTERGRLAQELGDARKRLREAEAELNELDRRRNGRDESVLGYMDARRYRELTALVEQQYGPAVAQLTQRVELLKTAEQGLASDLKDIATAQRDAAEGTITHTDALKAQREAVDNMVTSLGRLAQLELQRSGGQSAGAGALGSAAQAAAARWSIGERLAAAPGMLTTDSVSQMDISAGEAAFQQMMDAYWEQMEREVWAPAAFEADQRLYSVANGIGATGSSIAAGDPIGAAAGVMNAAGYSNPILAIVMAIVQAFSQIGALEVRDPKTGEVITSASEVLGDRIEDWFENTIAGIQGLSTMVLERLPDILSQWVPELIRQAILDAPRTWEAGNRVAMELGDMLINDMPDVIRGAIVEAFEDGIDRLVSQLTDLFNFSTDENGDGWFKRTKRTAGKILDPAGVFRRNHSGGFSDTEHVALLRAQEVVVPLDMPMRGMTQHAVERSPAAAAQGGVTQVFNSLFLDDHAADRLAEQQYMRHGPDGLATGMPTAWGS